MATPNSYLGLNGKKKAQKKDSSRENSPSGRETQTHSAEQSGSDVSTGDVEGEADEDDSSAVDDMSDEAETPDASALSGARHHDDEKRLAGLDDDDDMFMSDAAQAVAGAAEDDDYTGLAEVSDDDNLSVGSQISSVPDGQLEQELIAEFEQEEEVDHSMDPFDGLAFGDDQYGHLAFQADVLFQPVDKFDDLAAWRHANSSEELLGTKKRVRFQEPNQALSRTSSMSSSEDANEVWPDLFDAQDDPALRRNFGLDYDIDASFQPDVSDNGSVFDFDGDDEAVALGIDFDEEESDSDVAMSSSGSDDEDDGDTTDEETEEEQLARWNRIRKAAGKSPRDCFMRPTPASEAPATPASASSTGTPRSQKAGNGPQLGSFTIDKSRATMSADGKTIKIWPPKEPKEKDKPFWDRVVASHGGSGSSTPIRRTVRMPTRPKAPPRPLTTQSTLSTMFHENYDSLFNNNIPSPAADPFPPLALGPRALFVPAPLASDSDTETQDHFMQQFVDLDPSDSESDDPDAALITSPTQPDIFDTLSGPSRHDSGASLLHHLTQEPGRVRSFHNNQVKTRHLTSLPPDPSKRASASEQNAFQVGKRRAANTPITPARKKRASQDLSLTGAGVRKSFSSPSSARRPRSRGKSLSGLDQTFTKDIFDKSERRH